MPLKTAKTKKAISKAIGDNIKELMMDNNKKGKEMGAKGKKRPMKQILAIAISSANKKKK